ncbi:MAG: acyl-CoA thioesterase [Alphaproteobacteria bacterium]|nr:acyl-CoA thioesterase [Alphaproteobacteria bacterium]MBT4083932.1 acyl-CoA thioesterase [Alphaproteobacteria bacterium]MBT4542537.1 acyl-CoA thioesterase [Alphaproteobacteria bacterium]MBT7747491.1 acyl-CoA thioesterase [Alphaproteobacteria bacterium]
MTLTVEQSEGVDLTSADTFDHWIRESIRFADLDSLGHVNNVAFSTYYESGRVRYFSDLGSPVDLREFVWMAVKISVEFKAQMNWPGFVDVGSSIVKMGRTSMVIGAGLFVDGTCTSTSECIMVYVNSETSKAVEIPDSIRQGFLNKVI